tara:strand:- start:1758 stop:2021 length:264 start_codon:yes stop_codon:yes gene_type:complete
MAKGTASKSSSGAAMSKYDVEVEARLQALEAQAHPTPTGATQKKVDDRLDALENAVKELQSSGGGSSDASDHDKIIELERLVNRLRT